MGWTGRAENSGHFCLHTTEASCRDSTWGREELAGGTAGEEVNVEQGKQSGMEKFRTKLGD